MTYLDLSSLKASQSTGFFVTGTDTDVGKTFVSARIANLLHHQGVKVAPRKPIASGCIRQTDGRLLSTDALQLQQGAQSSEPLNTICPYQFEPALSPQTALAMAEVTVTTHDLVAACQTPTDHFALVEGAGGFLSPLCSNGLNRDLAAALQLPVILVVANRLGCLNHALLSIEAIEHTGLSLHSVIINHTARTDYNFAQDLHQWCQAPIYEVPFDESA